MEDVIADAWRKEEALLTPSVRSSAALLDQLLDPEFCEIGQSGRRWSRAETITALGGTSGAEAEQTSAAIVSARAAHVVAPGVVQLMYVLELHGALSQRSSLWRTDGETLRCVFHQGTPLRREAPDAT